EGTTERSAAELAQAVEFLGASLSASSGPENTTLVFRALRKDLDKALELVAEVATQPAFRSGELQKLKRRQLDRLALSERNPRWLARRAFFKRLYGDHTYAHTDTTPEAVEQIDRGDLRQWHETYFVPSNAFLVVAGD